MASSSSSSNGAAARTRRSAAPAPEISYHHGDLRNALIREGRLLLEEVGLRDMSLREVARRVGVSAAAPARHFDGKDALLAAIAQSGFDELAQERREILAADLAPLETARRMMLGYVSFARSHVGQFYLMVGPKILERGLYPELVQSSDASFRFFADAVCAFARLYGWPAATLERVVHSAWATEHGLATLIIGNRVPRPGYDVPVEDMVQFSLSLLFTGIAAGPAALKSVQPPRRK
jgi:AcrR family transcriptional regulator